MINGITVVMLKSFTAALSLNSFFRIFYFFFIAHCQTGTKCNQFLFEKRIVLLKYVHFLSILKENTMFTFLKSFIIFVKEVFHEVKAKSK